MRTCEITPGCENLCEGRTNGCASCNHAKRKSERQAKKMQIVHAVPKVTAKRNGQMQEYWKLRGEYLALYPVCEVEDCNLKAVEIHHQRGRENEKLLDTNYFMAVCHAHHQEIHRDHQWATDNDYKLKRSTENEKERDKSI